MTHATSQLPALVVVEGNGRKGKHVVTMAAIPAGAVILQVTGYHVLADPNRFTVQAGADIHLAGIGPLTFMNHSCAPNVIIVTPDMTVRAIHDIQAGEELTFFYPSTEWQLAEPFECHCGAASCIGVIAGAATLPEEVLSRYFVNEHILALRRAR
jgi:SET domain